MGHKGNTLFRHTEEAKARISTNNGRKRAVSQFDLQGEFI
jgi:hypothetical protein